MPNRIEVASDVINAGGNGVRKRILSDLGFAVDEVRVIDVYTLDASLEKSELSKLGKVLFSDPITQKFSVDKPMAKDFDWLIEVGFKPGVTDNVGVTAGKAVQELIDQKVGVYTSKQYILCGTLTQEQVQRISHGLLANDLIERVSVKSYSEWDPDDVDVYVPKVTLHHEPQIRTIDFINATDEDLLRMNKENVWAGNLDELKKIQNHFRKMGRNPKDAEPEIWFQTNSEHNKHKIFTGKICYHQDGKVEIIDSLFKTFIRGATQKIRKSNNIDLVSVFSDNAGIVRLDNDYNIAFKVETHNSPSALDPYGGAITGIVGVNRDIIGVGQGARPIANIDVFCFADPNYQGHLPERIKHPKVVQEGVRKGVEHGGNKSGIPTVNGAVRYDSYPFGSVAENGAIQSYMGKPLVYCGTVGIAPSRINQRNTAYKRANPGDLIFMVGGLVGKDGIHGATFSSESLHQGSPATAVQIGDPITQKKMIDMLLEARDSGLYTSITDNGAGGLSGSVGEMAKESGGAELHLDRAPLKYSGLDPWEILLSEAQERMTVAVHPKNSERFLELARKHDVEANALGTFTNSGYFHVSYNGKEVANLDLEFLHNGSPKRKMIARWTPIVYKEPQFGQPDLSWALKRLLSRLNIASKEPVIRQYDHKVQGATIIEPLVGIANDGPSDAAVLWPIEMQAKGSYRGLALSNGINSNYGLIDTYHMAAANLDEAIRNAVAVGANPNKTSLLDNFCWSSSDDEHRLGQLVRACKALYDNSIVFKTPFISGKDSMFNDYKGKLDGKDVKISAPPSLLISAMGIVPDIRKTVTMDAKSPGDLVYVLGQTRDELGGSEYYAMMGEDKGEAWVGNNVPKVDARKAVESYKALHKAITRGYVTSAHDISEGGLGVALAEMAFAGGYGINVNLQNLHTGIDRSDFVLFSESQSRLIVTVPKKYSSSFESTLKGTEYSLLGKVTEDKYLIAYGTDGRWIFNEPLSILKNSWQSTFK